MAVKKINSAEQATVFVASGTSHAAGIVPDPGGTAGTSKFLREDATWQTPSGGGGGVTSLNTLTGGLTLVAGTNVTITPSGSNITIDASGSFSGTAAHFVGTSSAPTITAGPDAGTGATATVAGRDSSGTLTVNMGTGTTGNDGGDIATVTFATAYGAIATVVLTATEQNAARLSGVYVVCSTGSFELRSFGVPTAGNTYIWNYVVIGT